MLKHTRLLEMLSLTNLFKSYLNLFIKLGIVFITIPLSLRANEKNLDIPKQDFFPFKVKNQIYSANETLDFIKQTKQLDCVMFGESFLLKFLKIKNFDNNSIKSQIDQFIETKQISENLKNYFMEVVLLLKLKTYIESQTYRIDENLSAIIIKSDKMNNCDGLGIDTENKKLVLWLEDLVKLEMYFKSRFKDSTFVISDSEINNISKNNPELSKTSIRAKLLKKKRSESIEIFLQSISKQISHEYFWK